MDFMDNITKYISFAFAILMVFLFYARPENNISPEDFISKMKEFSYKTYYAKKVQNADISYVASSISNVKVYYHHFNHEEDCKNYYSSLTANSKGKPMYDSVRDQRLNRVASEKLTYQDDDIFYAFLYTGNAVIHAKTYSGNKMELINMFKSLDTKKQYSFGELVVYYQNYFKKTKTNIITN